MASGSFPLDDQIIQQYTSENFYELVRRYVRETFQGNVPIRFAQLLYDDQALQGAIDAGIVQALSNNHNISDSETVDAELIAYADRIVTDYELGEHGDEYEDDSPTTVGELFMRLEDDLAEEAEEATRHQQYAELARYFLPATQSEEEEEEDEEEDDSNSSTSHPAATTSHPAAVTIDWESALESALRIYERALYSDDQMEEDEPDYTSFANQLMNKGTYY